MIKETYYFYQLKNYMNKTVVINILKLKTFHLNNFIAL